MDCSSSQRATFLTCIASEAPCTAREKYLHCIACNLGKGGAVGAEELVLFVEREMETTMLLPFSAIAHWWLSVSENN